MYLAKKEYQELKSKADKFDRIQLFMLETITVRFKFNDAYNEMGVKMAIFPTVEEYDIKFDLADLYSLANIKLQTYGVDIHAHG